VQPAIRQLREVRGTRSIDHYHATPMPPQQVGVRDLTALVAWILDRLQ